MKLHILSDLHLEIAPFLPPETDGDVIILAGDIAPGTAGLEWAAQVFRHRNVIYVPGNHECYGHHLSKVALALREVANDYPNIHLLDNDETIINGVRYLGTTLWTDFQLFGKQLERVGKCLAAASLHIADFRMIRYGSTGYFSPAQSAQLHFVATAWLAARLPEPFYGRTVVVSHHAPHRRSIAEQFRDDVLSAAFVSDLDSLMGPPVDVWVHGHTHTSFDYVVRGTRVVCNPRGYVRNGVTENSAFVPGFLVDI